MRTIKIYRKSHFAGAAIALNVYVDGIKNTQIRNGKSATIILPDNANHEIRVTWQNTSKRENDAVLLIKPEEYALENEELSFTIDIKGLSKLLFIGNDEYSNDIATTSDRINKSMIDAERTFDKRILAGPTICAIIYSIIMLAFAILFYTITDVPVFIFIVDIILILGIEVSVIIDGRYLVIIPLPIIYLWKIYDSKPLQSLKVRKICLTIIFISIILFLALNIIFASIGYKM